MEKICQHLTLAESMIISEIRSGNWDILQITKDKDRNPVLLESTKNSIIELQAILAKFHLKIGDQEVELMFEFAHLLYQQILTRTVLPKEDF